MRTKKRGLSLFITLCLIVGMLPQTAFATQGVTTGTGGLCEHHTAHDETCGYVEAAEGTPCTHEHSEDCYEITESCTHTHSEECYPVLDSGVSGNEATPSDAAQPTCGHECSEESGCITEGLNCTHTHDDLCGYIAAVEGHDCHYECAECTEESETPTTQVCTCEAAEGQAHAEDCALYEAPADSTCTCETKCTEDAINHDCAICSTEGADLSACTGEEASAAPVCDCGTDDEAIHATTCGVYVAPENPVCYCVEKCTEVNIWCDVCGFDISKCSGADRAVGYAEGDSVSYVDYTWNEESKTLSSETKSVDTYTEITSTTTEMISGWYVVNGEVTVAERMTATGEVHLILADGAHLTASLGITVNEGNSLYIYGQSSDESTMGKLTATTTNSNAAIGGLKLNHAGTIVINGGNINASTSGYGAGIGSSEYRGGYQITINAGVVIVTSSGSSAAIGSGNNGGDGAVWGTVHSICINGGVVNATQTADGGAAIGGGNLFDGGDITITGGTVTATNKDAGAAIGGGMYGSGGNITITGGNVSATYTHSFRYGAAIGAGYYGESAGNILITGGTVTATSNRGCGIGVYNGDNGRIVILGGTVNASGSGNVHINAGASGSMMLVDGTTVTISGDFTLQTDFVLPEGYTLEISEGATLTIPEGVTLTLPEEYTLINNGTVNAVGTVHCISHKYVEGVCICGLECNHVGGTPTCMAPAVCTTCGTAYGEVDPTNHNWENGVCTYGCNTIHEPHDWSGKDGICTICGSPCSHTGGTATCTEKAVCTVCGTSYGELADHTLTYSASGSIITESCTNNCEYSETATIEAPTGTIVYDGTQKEGATVSYSENWQGARDLTPTYANNINAGTATASISVMDGGNEVKASVTFEIAKANASISADPTAKTGLAYTGNPQELITVGTATGGEMQYSLDDTNYSTTIPAGTAVQEYTVYYKVVGDSNHNDTAAQTITVSISKGTAPAITEPTARGIEYGQPLSASTLSDTNWKWVDGTVVPNSIGNYEAYLTVDDTNYDYSSVTGYNETAHTVTREIQVIVSKTTPAITVQATPASAIAGKTITVSATVKNPHNESLSDLPTPTYTYKIGDSGEETGFTGSFVIPENTATGTTITITATTTANDKYVAGTGTATVIVTDCTHAGNKTFQHDTASHWYVCGECGAELDKSAHSWGYTANGDTITKSCQAENCPGTGAKTIVISANSKVYDGTAVTATVTNHVDSTDYSASIVYEAKTGTLTEGKAINAGTYTAKITVGGATASVDFTISKIPLTIQAKDQTITYGQDIAAGTDQVAATRLVGGDTFTGVTLTPSTTDVVTNGTITPSAADIRDSNGNNVTANYAITYRDGSLTINKAISGIHFNSYTPDKTYDGTAIANPTAGQLSITGAGYRDVEFAWYKDSVAEANKLPAAPSDAGTYYVVATIPDSQNTSASSVTSSAVTISPKEITSPTITLEKTSYEYDGQAKEPAVTVKDGTVLIPDREYKVAYSHNTNAGTSATVTITDMEGGNYTISGTASFTITKADPAYTAPTGLTATYGQTLNDVTLTAAAGDVGTWGWSAPTTSVGNVGTHSFEATFTPSDTANYNTKTIYLAVTVGKANLTIQAQDQTITYGQDIAAGTDQVAATGLVGGDTLTGVTLTPGISDVGTGVITPSAAEVSSLASNYNITYQTGTLTITQAAAQSLAETLYVTNNHAGTYTLDLSGITPTSGSWGGNPAVSFALGTVSLDQNYYDSGADVAKGRLTLPIKTYETATEGSIGTVAVTITSQNFVESTLTVTVMTTNKTPVTIEGVTPATGLVYNGAAQQGYTGSPTNPQGYTGGYTFSYADAQGNPLTQAPTAAGSYTVTISVPGSSGTHSGSRTLPFQIAQKQLSWGAGTAVISQAYVPDRLTVVDTSSITPDSIALSGVVAGDDVGWRGTVQSASFADDSIGTGKPVAVALTGLVLTGADAHNYLAPTGTLTITGDITAPNTGNEEVEVLDSFIVTKDANLPKDASYYGDTAGPALDQKFGTTGKETMHQIEVHMKKAGADAIAALAGVETASTKTEVLEISLKYWDGDSWEKIDEEHLDDVLQRYPNGVPVTIPYRLFGFTDTANYSNYQFVVQHMITLPTDDRYAIGDIEDLSGDVTAAADGLHFNVMHGFSPFVVGFAETKTSQGENTGDNGGNTGTTSGGGTSYGNDNNDSYTAPTYRNHEEDFGDVQVSLKHVDPNTGGGPLEVEAPAIVGIITTPDDKPESTDPRRGLADTTEDANKDIEKDIPGVFEPEVVAPAPDDATESQSKSGGLFAGIALLLAALALGGGYLYFRKRKEAE